MERPTLTLDDLSVGQRFESDTLTVTADEIVAYATLYDPQPFHTDPEAAKTSFFGGLAASGWHTAALSMRLLIGSFRVEGGIIGGGGDLQWMKPVRPGDTLRVETEILAITPSRTRPDRASVLIRVLTRNQDGDDVQSFTPKLVVTR